MLSVLVQFYHHRLLLQRILHQRFSEGIHGAFTVDKLKDCHQIVIHGVHLAQRRYVSLIVRKVYSEIPPKVEYELSEIGHKFEKVLAELEIWGNEYIEYLNKCDTTQMAT